MSFDPTPSPLFLELSLLEYRGFSSESSYWFRYEAAAASGISSIQGNLVINDQQYGLNVDLHFDPSSFPTKEYGLPYGDDTLEASINSVICDVLGVECTGLVQYTEQGMQTDTTVSLEAGDRLREVFESISSHQLLHIINDARVLSIAGPFGSFSRDPSDPGEKPGED